MHKIEIIERGRIFIKALVFQERISHVMTVALFEKQCPLSITSIQGLWTSLESRLMLNIIIIKLNLGISNEHVVGKLTLNKLPATTAYSKQLDKAIVNWLCTYVTQRASFL